MKRFWIKLELKTLHDPIMGQMPNYLWRRVIELLMLAGENGDDGLLQPVIDLAWQLHTSVSDMDNSLRTLAELGVVNDTPQGWVVTGFKESQASSTSTQRVQEYRKRIGSGTKMKRKRKEDELKDEIEDETEDETKDETEEERSPSSSTSVSNSLSFSDSDSDSDSDPVGDEVQEKGAANAFAVYEANIDALTPMLADALRADIADFSEGWVCDAIQEAVKSNARSLKYVEAILNTLSSHQGRRNRAEKWMLIETVFGVQIPKAERNPNNYYDRQFRLAISTMRHNGLLVGSDSAGGYWLMEGIDEVLDVADQFRRRAKDLLHSASKLESTGWSVFGSQRRLF